MTCYKKAYGTASVVDHSNSCESPSTGGDAQLHQYIIAVSL